MSLIATPHTETNWEINWEINAAVQVVLLSRAWTVQALKYVTRIGTEFVPEVI
jgi:hypothetical protein